MKIGFIGIGNMGSALAKAVLSECSDDKSMVYVSDNDAVRVSDFCDSYGSTPSDNQHIAAECDVIFLGVKPQVLPMLCSEIRSTVSSRSTQPVLVSMAAGITLDSIEKMFAEGCSVIRIMPNLPASVGKGVILYCINSKINKLQENAFLELMQYAGYVCPVEEKLFDASSALTGCGPAFVSVFIEALADGAVSCGVPRDKALGFALETVMGTAELLKASGKHPAVLKDEVCSPAGSTIEGVKALENGNLRGTVIGAINASYQRTKELGKNK